jgi:hypothetical protein
MLSRRHGASAPANRNNGEFMNTRKDNKGKARKQWIATPPGHIARPLRHIGDRTNGRNEKGQVVLSIQSILAREAASRGDGRYVQQMARSLL